MSSDRARRALEILESALDIEPENRAAWLKDACDGDEAVEAEVLSMLELLPESAGFLPVADDVTQRTFAVTHRGFGAPQVSGRSLERGDQIGDFRIEEEIGVGGMGIVYRARQLSLERDVALKILPSALRASQSATGRFHREVEAAARLNHDNIVAVFTMGEDSGTPYYAMELIDGFPLSKVIQHLHAHPIPAVALSTVDERYRAGQTEMIDTIPDWAVDALIRCPSAEASGETESPVSDDKRAASADYFHAIASNLADVADGLHYAHQNQVIHRDIKPSNLLLSSDGGLHISDFGLARMLDEPGLTRSGEMVGTTYYMSPEQISPGAAEIDGRTDIYSIGATLYEMLTLRPPFLGDTRGQVISQILDREPVPPQRLNRQVPQDLQTICMKALEKEPSRRYDTAADLAHDLRAFAAGSSIAARSSGPLARTGNWARRHVTPLSFVGAICLAVAAAFFAYRAHESDRRWSEIQQQRVFEGAVLAAMQGDADRADKEIDQAQQLGASEGRVHLLRGQADWHAAHFGSAYEHFVVAAEKLPENLAAQSLLALSLMKRQDYARGEAMMPSIRRLTPRRLEDYLYHARLENYYDSQQAIGLLDEAVRRDKTSIVARLVRGDVRMARAVDSADVADAETAVLDYGIARELLGSAPIVTTGLLKSHLAAATAYGSAGQTDKREEHIEEADAIIKSLAEPPVTTQSRRLRALYFDYLGDTDRAIAEWRKIQDNQIVFLVLTLYRDARFDEALEVCDRWLKDHSATRMTDFFQAFVIAATASSAHEVRSALDIEKGARLDPMHELIITQTMGCLIGDVDASRAEGRRIRKIERLPTFRNNWYRVLVDYACGDVKAKQLLEKAAQSRRDRCEAHYYVGVRMLAAGDRSAAIEHFTASAAAGVYNYFEHFLSMALLHQLKRDPSWPPWIPAKP